MSRFKLTRRRMQTAALTAALTLAGLCASASTAAGLGITNVDTTVSTTAAGAHPDVRLRVDFTRLPSGEPEGELRDMIVEMPPGLVGNPQGVETCPDRMFFEVSLLCPTESQVGGGTIHTWDPNTGDPLDLSVRIFNLNSPASEPARLGIAMLLSPTTEMPLQIVRFDIRTGGDYGLSAISKVIGRPHPITGVDLEFWGVPADHTGVGERQAFMSAPTFCGTEPLRTEVRVNTFEDASHWSVGEAYDVPATECEGLRFEPTVQFQPENLERGRPTGLDVQLAIPQSDDPDGRIAAHLRDVDVSLPPGMSVSPSAANGLGACSPQQITLGDATDPMCPDVSKVGDVSIVTPLLPDVMTGAIYIAQQNHNPFSSTLALYLAARGNGINIKLAGHVAPDPTTGQVHVRFANNPQLPFSRLAIKFKGGERATLSNPSTCGLKTTTTELRAWNGAVARPTDSFEVTSPVSCDPGSFSPSFQAGSVAPVGGGSSSFSLTLGRGDLDQELGDVTVDMPEGLTGKIADAVLCSDSAAAAGACGEASRIGTVTSAAGPGTTPFYLPGRAYITGPYKGAPFGLAFIVPAVAGPFELGTVVVRAAIFVDRRDASLRVVSDRLPRILHGIPLQIRMVDVAIDRPGFMLNPTSCGAKQVRGRIVSQQGAAVDVSSRYRVGGCGSLPLRQRMSVAVGARGKTGSDRRTPLAATMRQPPGMGNLRSVAVVLPKVLNGRLDVIQRDRACTIPQLEADRCPTVIGHGVATTPLLRDPLRGPAYFVYNPERRLPDIVVRLRGQVDIDLVGKVTIPRDLTLRTMFDTVPDVPVSMFRLSLESGRGNGAIGVVTNLCSAEARRARARITMIGHNGRRADVRQPLRIRGCGRAAQPSRSARRTQRPKR